MPDSARAESSSATMDPRVTRFTLEFPAKAATGSAGLEPTQTYYGRVVMQTAAAVGVRHVDVVVEGWERVDVGAKGAAAARTLFRAQALLAPAERAVNGRAVFEFACTMPNVNYPAAMRSAICEIAYSASATAVSASGRLVATHSVAVAVAPRVEPAGVGWLKALVLRDGVEVAGGRRRLRVSKAPTPAMAICVRVRNHCCRLGEAIAVDIDATMQQRDRVLACVRAAVVEQVALKPRAGEPPTVLAERTLNRKSVADPTGLAGVQDMLIRVPRRDVCTADGATLSFSHVLRLTFDLADSRGAAVSATKDVPLRLVTSKFGHVGRASQAEINRRLSALTADSDGGAVSEAYGYLLNESGRQDRPLSLDALPDPPPAPVIVALAPPAARPSPPLSVRSASQDSCVVPPTPATDNPTAFQFGPLPPLPMATLEMSSQPSSTRSTQSEVFPLPPSTTQSTLPEAFCFAPPQPLTTRARDTLVNDTVLATSSALGVSLPHSYQEDKPAPHSLADKRESSQSESNTIVFSPRADLGMAGDAVASSTRSPTPEPPLKPASSGRLLLTLPAFQPLDDIPATDLLNSSTVFDNLEFSSYWTNTGFC